MDQQSLRIYCALEQMKQVRIFSKRERETEKKNKLLHKSIKLNPSSIAVGFDRIDQYLSLQAINRDAFSGVFRRPRRRRTHAY